VFDVKFEFSDKFANSPSFFFYVIYKREITPMCRNIPQRSDIMNPKWKYVKGDSGLAYIAPFFVVFLNPYVLFILIILFSLILFDEEEKMDKRKRKNLITFIAIMIFLLVLHLVV